MEGEVFEGSDLGGWVENVGEFGRTDKHLTYNNVHNLGSI